MSATGKTPEQLRGMIHKHYRQFHSGDGATVEFDIGGTVMRVEDLMVFVAGLLQRAKDGATAYDYSVRGLSSGYDGDTNRIRFSAPPAGGARIDILRIGG